MRILLVDDDWDIRAIMCFDLTNAGHEMAQAADGREALLRSDGAPFDLLIVDIFMPVMDGLETIRIIHDRLPRLPILAISGSKVRAGIVAPSYLDAAMAFGASVMLSKPFSSRELLCAVEQSIDRREVGTADRHVSASSHRP